MRVVWLSDSGGSWGLGASEIFHVETLVEEAAEGLHRVFGNR